MQRKVSFILGAGASLASCMPSTDKITTQILSGNGVMRHTNGCFYFAPPLYGMPDEYVPKVVSFLTVLKVEIDSYYSGIGIGRATMKISIMSQVKSTTPNRTSMITQR